MMDHLPKRMLLVTDGSECAESAGRVAVDLANRSGAGERESNGPGLRLGRPRPMRSVVGVALARYGERVHIRHINRLYHYMQSAYNQIVV